ncbi:MAG: hypothetical protein HYW06_07785 [Gemmatimonadetes bacterium]|nr:hypothetical protein [Gemmatimonadota bacterium]MBI2536848.1 hypothetical protein [Gemmatimonadota bacterium]
MPTWPEARARKFRQAAFVYLHVGILYEAAAYVMWRQGLLPVNWGPGWLWLILGAAVAGAVFVGLLRWQNVWLARIVWLVHGLRLPSLIDGAFVLSNTRPLAPSFYLVAMVVVVVNLWMLARAGWDL